MTKLAIVVPCYNEEAALPHTCRRLVDVLQGLVQAGKVSSASRIAFVDDGSRDATWPLVQRFVADGLPVVGVRLSRNQGHQSALLAGLFSVPADATVTLDADLQDDPDAVGAMVDHFRDGADVVLGVRSSRSTDTAFKRLTARLFYRLLALLGVETVEDHADFRLLSRRAVDALRGFGETNLYLRGIIPLLGFRVAHVHYQRSARIAGTTKYGLRRMTALAIDAITSFSVAPLRAISALGILVSAGSALVTAWALWAAILTDRTVPGWASTVLPIYFLGGVQLLSIGVIGEYVGRLYLEAKRRPRYLIDQVIGTL